MRANMARELQYRFSQARNNRNTARCALLKVRMMTKDDRVPARARAQQA